MNDLAYSPVTYLRARTRESGRARLLALMFLVSFGCSAGVKGAGNPGAGGGGGGISGGGGSGGHIIPRDGGGLVLGTDGSDPDAAKCQEFEVMFEPKIPTVYLLVDRSGSMFDCITTPDPENSCPTPADTSWIKLKEGILPVVSQLQADVRFGFATITGTNPSKGGTCPVLDKVAPDLNNYAKIKTVYDMLAFPPNSSQSGVKFETPTSLVMQMVGAELLADAAPGEKYILFVTDGEPDYCGDGNTLCPPDGVIGRIQGLKAQGITTIVFGIMATSTQNLPQGVLEGFANAGAGEPTLPPLRGTNPKIEDFYDQCNQPGAPADDAAGGWAREFAATGKPQARGQTIGNYSTTAGPTKPYRPDVTNQTQLVQQLSLALAGVKSCVFDLGGHIMVNTARLSEATIKIQGNVIPLDGSNGWSMATPTELHLNGSACDSWRAPNVTLIDFGFPCDIIVQ